MALEHRIGRRLISALLIGHLGMLAIAAIPSPGDLAAAEGVRASADDAVSLRVRPALDAAATALRGFTKQAWHLTTFVRPFATWYVHRLGLSQTWNMFGSPPARAEYLRLRYFWTSGPESDGPLMTATELVFPAAADPKAHAVAAFWVGHQDKALSNAFGAYFLDRGRINVTSPTPEVLEKANINSLTPVAEFFSARYAARHLAPADRLARVEVWYGWAESRPRDDVLISPQSRAAALQRYYDGAPPHALATAPSTAIDTLEREADLEWILTFVKVP